MKLINLLKENTARIQATLSLLLKIILIISVVYSIYFHLWRILFINLLLLIIIFLPSLSKRINIEMPREIEFILLAFIIVSFFLGDLRGLIIQIFFGLVIGFVGFAIILILYKNSDLRPNYFLIMLFSLSISLSLGTISELLKYYIKLYLGYETNVGDYVYAMVSLGLVFIGALLASVFGYIYMKGAKFSLINVMVEKFKNKNPNLFIEKTDSPEEILKLIKKGENERLEFKSTLRTNIHTNECDKKIEYSVLKTIASFLNTDGGTLLIGISDSGDILGIERDHFQSNDKFNLHFTNLIKEYIGNQNLPYLYFELVLIENKNILKVDCKSSEKPVFLKFNKIEEFHIRVGASTVQIIGSNLVDYINNHFS